MSNAKPQDLLYFCMLLYKHSLPIVFPEYNCYTSNVLLIYCGKINYYKLSITLTCVTMKQYMVCLHFISEVIE